MPAEKKSSRSKKTGKSIVPAAPVEPVAAFIQPVSPAPVAPSVPVQPLPQTIRKPGMVMTIAILTLISGVINIIWGLGVATGLGLSIVLLCLAPIGFLPVVLGIFEIIYAVKLLANPPQPVQPNQAIAILEIVAILIGNIIAVIVGILALVFYNDAEVKAYFAKVNGQA